MDRPRSQDKKAEGTECVYRICDLPKRQRPRETMQRLGAENVQDDVLLAIVLAQGTHGLNVADLARNLLRRFGSLTNLASASLAEIQKVKGVGPAKAMQVVAALELAKRLSEERMSSLDAVKTPGDAADLLRERVRTLKREVFWAIPLDTKNRLASPPVEITRGLLDSSLVHAREVFTAAVEYSAKAVVLVHNHPSGDPMPSADDIRVTRQLVEAGKVVDIKVLDHVILGRAGQGGRTPEFISIREAGLVEFG